MNGKLQLVEASSQEGQVPAPAPPDLPLAHTVKGIKRRRIPGIELSAYEPPVIPGNWNLAWRVSWHLVNPFVFQGALLSLIPRNWKATLLRAFGTKVGKGSVCNWNNPAFRFFCAPIEIGDGCWVGAGTKIAPGTALQQGVA